jgi:hypothetical protein
MSVNSLIKLVQVRPQGSETLRIRTLLCRCLQSCLEQTLRIIE